MIENPYYLSDPSDYREELEETYRILNERVRQDRALRGYGRGDHGMNGKDADLDEFGQCVVTELVPLASTNSADLRIEIKLRLYATICSPSAESFNYEAVIQNASPDEMEYFRSIGADPRAINWDKDENAAYRIINTLVDYYGEQAYFIVCDTDALEAQRGDPFAVMFNDDAWEGGINVTLSVPLTPDECDALESHEYDDELLDTLAKRIATEIYEANKGGTPERDALKLWEEWVSWCNTEINKLGCYTQH